MDMNHTEVIEFDAFGGDGDFKGNYVEQVVRVRDSVKKEMLQKLNIADSRYLYSEDFMNKKNVTKEVLASWLQTVWCVLNSYAVPLLENGVPLLDKVTKYQEEKIKDQESIIDLQSKLIEKKDEELSDVKTTVQAEMKSYSSVVSKSCSAALAPKRIQAAVRKVADKNDRTKNVVIYGVKENVGEILEKKFEEILAEIDEKPRVKDVCRLGNVANDKIRPIKFTLASSDHVNQVLRNCKRLHAKEGFKSVYICPDRTVEERVAFEKLVEELRRKRTAEPDEVFIIRNNKIVSVKSKIEPVQTG